MEVKKIRNIKFNGLIIIKILRYFKRMKIYKSQTF